MRFTNSVIVRLLDEVQNKLRKSNVSIKDIASALWILCEAKKNELDK